MALPSSGPLSLSQVNTELDLTPKSQINLNSAIVRALFERPSGVISMSHGYGKASAFTATISSNQLNLNLRSWALANGWNGTSAATITVASGVYIWSNSTATAGMTIDGSWAGGLELVNNGFIIGMGGNGGSLEQNGSPGGSAVSLGLSVSIRNNNYIAGGGGGGASIGGGGAGGGSGSAGSGGSGGGPGSAGTSATTSSNCNGVPALGGCTPTAGSNGGGAGGGGGSIALCCRPDLGCQQQTGSIGRASGGGGRILPGTGGVGHSCGGAGGGSNSNGGNSTWGSYTGGGGGGWGASGGNTSAPSRSGGAGGRAVQLNGHSVTWLATGTRWGAIS